MTSEFLYEAITLIDDDLIDAAAEYTPKSKKVIHWKRWAALAACLVLVVGVGSLFRFGPLGGMMGGGTKSDSPAAPGQDPGNTGSTFMSYAGPIFPLTVLENSDSISAHRDLTLDFAPLPSDGSGSDITVTDNYLLTNSAAEDKTLTVLYPFVSSLRGIDECLPTLVMGGTEPQSEVVYGLYSGGFQGVFGSDDPNGSANLNQLDSWNGYKTLLEDGSYLDRALNETTDLSGIHAIVYEFSEPWGDVESKDKPNPSIRVTFDLDYEKTTVLSYGFHSGSFDREAGKMGQGFSIPQSHEPYYGQTNYLIVLGEDVQNMVTEGYITGGWTTEKKLDDFGVTVVRYETDLDSILRKAASAIYDNYDFQYGDSVTVDFETYYSLLCDHLVSYGILAEDGGTERYGTGWLEDLAEVVALNRVCYLKSQVTIPAGSSVEVTASMRKNASFDYYGNGSKSPHIKGYDVVTQLGSTLSFTKQTATLLDHGRIEIINQNFGFDLAQGITTVELDPSMEHYYLEVQRKPSN